MKGIELPILCHDTTSRSLESLGIKYNLSECDIKPMRFYVINCVTPFVDDDFTGTHVFSGNTIFVCPLKYDELIQKIEDERGA